MKKNAGCANSPRQVCRTKATCAGTNARFADVRKDSPSITCGICYPGADIPAWVMTELGPLVAKGDVTAGEFKTALEYVLGNA